MWPVSYDYQEAFAWKVVCLFVCQNSKSLTRSYSSLICEPTLLIVPLISSQDPASTIFRLTAIRIAIRFDNCVGFLKSSFDQFLHDFCLQSSGACCWCFFCLESSSVSTRKLESPSVSTRKYFETEKQLEKRFDNRRRNMVGMLEVKSLWGFSVATGKLLKNLFLYATLHASMRE